MLLDKSGPLLEVQSPLDIPVPDLRIASEGRAAPPPAPARPMNRFDVGALCWMHGLIGCLVGRLAGGWEGWWVGMFLSLLRVDDFLSRLGSWNQPAAGSLRTEKEFAESTPHIIGIRRAHGSTPQSVKADSRLVAFHMHRRQQRYTSQINPL